MFDLVEWNGNLKFKKFVICSIEWMIVFLILQILYVWSLVNIFFYYFDNQVKNKKSSLTSLFML